MHIDSDRQPLATNTHARTHTHTQLLNDLLSRDYLSELVPEETFTPSHPWGNEEGEGFAQMTRSTVWKLIPFIVLWKRELLDPIKPAYKQSRPDGWTKLTASAFNRLWISMPAVLVTVPTVTQNSLHPFAKHQQQLSLKSIKPVPQCTAGSSVSKIQASLCAFDSAHYENHSNESSLGMTFTMRHHNYNILNGTGTIYVIISLPHYKAHVQWRKYAKLTEN